MLPPLTKALTKIFANGFYRANSGLLVFFFITIFIYFFFIEVLNQTHLTFQERLLFNLSLVLAFISNPIMMAVVFGVWLIYTIKSWQYVAGQLLLPEQQFLFYSSTALSKVKQFKTWCLVQLIIFLPVIGYGLFSFVIALIFHQYLIPVIILLYIMVLTGISAFLYVQLVNGLVKASSQSYLLKMTYRWPKPFFSLFLYYLFDKIKFSYVLTKILSGLSIIGVFYFFSDVNDDLRVAGVAVLVLTTVHAYLIYQEHRFRETYLRFSRNLPYSRIKLFFHFAGVYLLLLLPESSWLFTKFNLIIALQLVLFSISTALLFQSLLYWFGLNMLTYLRGIGSLILLYQFLIMAGYLEWLVPGNLVAAFALFYRSYYRYKPIN